MKRFFSFIVFLLVAMTGLGAALHYSLEYRICGSAASRLLFFFPLRVYYDASALIDFEAFVQADGKTRFVFLRTPRSPYLLRTLGFGAKTVALLTVNNEGGRDELFRDRVIARWQQDVPEFAARVKNYKKFPHRLIKNGKDGLSFSRDRQGRYGDFILDMETRYVYHPSRTGMYFNIFPMLGEFLNMLNHPFMPVGEISQARYFPSEWYGDWLDYSPALNRIGGLLEKIVKSLVTVRQAFPFRLQFRVIANGPDEVEFCGHSFPDVPLWKDFMIREIFRRVKVRLADEVLLLDEIWIGIRNRKGHGGFGRLQLRLID